MPLSNDFVGLRRAGAPVMRSPLIVAERFALIREGLVALLTVEGSGGTGAAAVRGAASLAEAAS